MTRKSETSDRSTSKPSHRLHQPKHHNNDTCSGIVQRTGNVPNIVHRQTQPLISLGNTIQQLTPTTIVRHLETNAPHAASRTPNTRRQAAGITDHFAKREDWLRGTELRSDRVIIDVDGQLHVRQPMNNLHDEVLHTAAAGSVRSE